MSEIISILAIAAVMFGLGVLAGLCWSLVIIDRREPPPKEWWEDNGWHAPGPPEACIDGHKVPLTYKGGDAKA